MKLYRSNASWGKFGNWDSPKIYLDTPNNRHDFVR